MTRNRSRKIFLPILGAIAFTGLLCRLAAGFQLLESDRGVAHPLLVTDMATYLNYAREILAGHMPREFYYQPFYYSVFLPAVQFFTGESAGAVIVAQSVCGALAVYLAGLLAARLAGRTAGYCAAGLLAFSRTAIVYTPFALLETMQSLWLTLLLWTVFLAWKRRGLHWWLVAGVVLSFAILSRGNAWFFLPAAILAAYFASRGRLRRKTAFLSACGALILGTVLPQIPFAAVNSVERGELRGPSTAGGNVLALGNTPEAPPGGLAYPETYQLWMSTENEISVPKRILAWAAKEPGAFLELQFRKVFLFWNHEEIPNNISPEESGRLSPLMNAVRFLPSGVLFVLALTGIFLSFKKIFKGGKERLLVAVLFVLLYNLGMAAFYNLARFRVPAFGLIAVLAGCGTVFFLRGFRRGAERRKRVFFTLAAGFAGFVAVYPGFDVYREFYEPGAMKLVRPHGVNVPTRKGGVLFYDHGPKLIGGWKLITRQVLIKTFDPEKPVAAGTPVRFSLGLIRGPGAAMVTVNGVGLNLTGLEQGRIAMIGMTLPYPEDNAFRIEFEGNVGVVVDTQRDYGRTYGGDGQPLGAELVAEVVAGNRED